MADTPVPPQEPAPQTEAEVDAFVHEHLKAFYPEIGRIASVWAMLEFRMDQLIWHLMGVEQTLGACLTTQLSGAPPRLRNTESNDGITWFLTGTHHKIEQVRC
jgi:hypothetical protein